MYSPNEAALIRNQLLDNYSHYAEGLDSKDWRLVRECFADDILIDYGDLSSASGSPEVLRRADDWIVHLQTVINGFDVTRHAITNHRVSVGESGAVSCRAYLCADHIIFPDPDVRKITAEDIVTLVGEYNNHYEQINGVWKIVKSELNVEWTSGNTGLLAIAVARATGNT